MDNFQVFVYARDTDVLRNNTKLVSQAFRKRADERGVEVVQAQVYNPLPHLLDAESVLAVRDFDLYLVSHTLRDQGGFYKVLDDVALKDGAKLVLAGFPLDDYVKDWGITLLKRPDGYLQQSDIPTLVSLISEHSALVR